MLRRFIRRLKRLWRVSDPPVFREMPRLYPDAKSPFHHRTPKKD